MSLKSLKTDQNLETEGVWNKFTDADGGEFRVNLARAGGSNHKYNKALTRIAKQMGFRLGSMSAAENKALYRELLVEHCIKGWETKVDGTWQSGIDFDGEGLLAVTKENLLMVLTELPDLSDQLFQHANEMGAYRDEELEEAAKN